MQFGVGCPGFHLRFVVKASQTMITSKESEILCGPPNEEGASRDTDVAARGSAFKFREPVHLRAPLLRLLRFRRLLLLIASTPLFKNNLRITVGICEIAHRTRDRDPGLRLIRASRTIRLKPAASHPPHRFLHYPLMILAVTPNTKTLANHVERHPGV